MTKRLKLVAPALLVLAVALAGCGGQGADDGDQVHVADNGQKYNDADVTFATDMIQHHAQALVMVDLTIERTLDPDVKALTEAIRDAQAPEIEQMTGWLQAWDQPVPETVRDHEHADSGDMSGMDLDDDMPGMMSGADLQALEDATDAEFQQMWLDMMIWHHQGAITMARTEQADGANQGALTLARQIVAAQTAEVATMQQRGTS